MVVRYSWLVLLLLLSFSGVADVGDFIDEVTTQRVENDCLYYYYGMDCQGCEETSSYLDKVQLKYPQLELERFEVYHNAENHNALQEFFTAYKIPEESQGVPVVFTKDGYFVGENTIKRLLEDRIRSTSDPTCPKPEEVPIIGIVGEKESEDVMETLTFASISGTALKDSFEPGALTLILILLILLFGVKDDKKMLKRGLLFVVGVFIAALLYGLGFFSWFGTSNIGFFFYKIVALLAVFTGLLSMKGFFKTKDVWLESITEKTRARIERILHSLVSPYSFLLIGFVASFFTFFEFGTVFLSLRVLMMDSVMQFVIWPMLLYYIFMYVFHLVAVVLFLYFIRIKLHEIAERKGQSSDAKIELWRKHNRKVLHFAVAAVLTILGLIILFI